MTLTDYHNTLEGSPAWDFLTGRGLDPKIIRWAQLGYVETPEPEHLRFQGCLSIPYFDGLGRERGIRFRYLGAPPPGRGKYDSPRGNLTHLYNVRTLQTAARIWIAEGELDCLILKQMGYPSVAIAGTNNWQTDWRLLFRDCEEVGVVFDSDPEKERKDGTKFRAGQDAARKVVSEIGGVVHAFPVDLPEGEDVSSLFLKDPAGLKAALG